MINGVKLNKGEVIDIVATGFATDSDVILRAEKVIADLGYIPRRPRELIQKHYLHANSDEKRFEYLRQALSAQDSRVIWCLRGGYGSNRLLPFLDKIKKPHQQKILIGLSDVTSLHLYMNEQWNWQTVHGPLLDRLGKGQIKKTHLQEMIKLLSGEKTTISYDRVQPLNQAAKKVTRLKKRIIGGNLVTFHSALATPWQPHLKNNFLFLEELGERGYKIDRLLTHLQQAKMLQGCAGILLGDFIGGQEPDGTSLVWTVLKKWSEQVAVPVWKGLPSGHAAVQRPIIFGAQAELLRTSKKHFSFKMELSR